MGTPYDLSGQSIGRYTIIAGLGQGGMAMVFRAFDTRLECDVAVKVIRRDAFSPAVLEQVLQRFEREAKAMAQLNHPNIVKVTDYGEYQGMPYLVMPFLPGGTLKERCGQTGQPPWDYRDAARLLLPVARALDYAHRRGMLHRDVKPANILINESGEPLLSDFGIAKLLEAGQGHTLTGTGVGIGTPDYMAPEQGLGNKVDARADVYSLGVVFYELVVGRKPYTADTPMAVVLKHVTDPLPLPSHFVSDLPEEAERVILKALAKQPEDRYGDMAAFAAALERLIWLGAATRPTIVPPVTRPAQPPDVTAQPASQPGASTPEPEPKASAPAVPGTETFDNMVEDNARGAQAASPARPEQQPPASAGVAPVSAPLEDVEAPETFETVATLPVAGPPLAPAAAAAPQFQGPPRTPDAAASPQQAKAARRAFTRRAFILAGGTILLLVLAGLALTFFNANRQLPTWLAALPAAPATQTATPAQPSATFPPVDTPTLTPSATPTLPSSSPITLSNIAQIRQRLRLGKGIPTGAIYSPYGTLLAVSTSLGVDIYDAQSFTLVRSIETGVQANGLAFSPDGTLIALPLEDTTVQVWNVQDGSLVWTLLGSFAPMYGVAISADGSLLAAASGIDHAVRLWSLQDGSLLKTLPVHTGDVYSVSFSADGKLLASAAADQTVRVRRVVDGATVFTLQNQSDEKPEVTFSPDGKLLATITLDGSAAVWRVSDGQQLTNIRMYGEKITCLAFSPDNSLLATGSAQNTIRMWKTLTGSLLRTMDSHANEVSSLAFSPDGAKLLSTSRDGAVKEWKVADGGFLRAVDGYSGAVKAVAFSTDSALLAAVTEDQAVRVWSTVDGSLALERKGQEALILSAAFSPDGKLLGIGTQDRTVQLWQLSDGTLVKILAMPGLATGLAFSPDGVLLAVAFSDNNLQTFNLEDGSPAQDFEQIFSVARSLAFSPDGSLLVSGSDNGNSRFWKTADGSLVQTISGDQGVQVVAFDPDGSLLIRGLANKTLQFWRVSDSTLLRTTGPYTAAVFSLALSPDSRLLATGSDDGTVSLFSAP